MPKPHSVSLPNIIAFKIGDMIKNIANRQKKTASEHLSSFFPKESVLRDFEVCCLSREASLLARKEVLTGKAKFGVTGDGKEVPQVALARVFRPGDFRSGYYRDQTLMFALGVATVETYFSQLYADTKNDPFSGGRQMNNHFATPLIDKETGEWIDHIHHYNITADISCTSGQMGRALGLSLASKHYRISPELQGEQRFSRNGQEICFCTIGDASTSEGAFWEVINAAGVVQAPLAIFVWDDGYGISVPTSVQTTKGSISEVLAGFQTDDKGRGIDIYTGKAWDYAGLVQLFSVAIETMRQTHRPAVFHIQEATQPQGHSTSGSHERYKSKERLDWEHEMDCILHMEQWILSEGIATPEELDAIKERCKTSVRSARDHAWNKHLAPVHVRNQALKAILKDIPEHDASVTALVKKISEHGQHLLGETLSVARRIRYRLIGDTSPAVQELSQWIQSAEGEGQQDYNTHLYSTSPRSALRAPVTPAVYGSNPVLKNGFEILNAFFDKALERDPHLVAFGEDVGHIGDVNQGFAGLQAKYGIHRVFDTGIREYSIIGKAIGMAMRGLRPIAEIQYIDYLIYGLEPLNDDLATLRYRSNGQQQAPAIIRTRGHRLEGIWHAGSPIGMILSTLRGMYVLTPRNMTQAAGMYNTMLHSDDPALVIECLNGYRLKEPMPTNIGEFTVPLGVPEVLNEGQDVTLVTYGSCVRIAQAAIQLLQPFGISVELIDVQTLIPFDLESRIARSLQKTNRLVILDEDVPGGASAYILQKILETQNGYRYLDSAPVTITASEHRTPYGSDGDYFSKPNAENVFEAVYKLLYEAEPGRFKGSL